MKKRIAIVGGGISGLICAYELQRSGFDVIVFEKESIPGGRMSTTVKDDLPFDFGADHLGDMYHEMIKYCDELGLSWEKMDGSLFGIYKHGHIVSMLKSISWWGRLRFTFFTWRLGTEADFFNTSTAVKYDSGNTYDYIKRSVGQEAADYITEGLVAGYNFHSSKEIGRAVMEAYMQSVKREHGFHRLHRIKGGMIALPTALAEKLPVKFNTTVKKITPGEHPVVDGKAFDAVVLACPTNVAENLLQDQTELQRNLFANTSYSTTISLSYKIDVDKLPKESVIFTPEKESKTVSSYTNQRMKGKDCRKNGKTLISVWLHEEFAKSIIDLPDAQVFKRCRQELAKVSPWLDTIDSLEPYGLYRWTHAMPKFQEGQVTRVKHFMETDQGAGNIFLCGDYLNSPWTEGSLRCGQRVAKQVKEKLS